MLMLPAATAGGFVSALRRYVGKLEYLPGKTTFVCETPDGPRGFCDCAGLLFLGLRDVGILSSNVDLNFAGAANRERELLRLTKRFGKRVTGKARIGDVLVSGESGDLHILILSDVTAGEMWVIEASHAGAHVWERRLDKNETFNRAFRFFEH